MYATQLRRTVVIARSAGITTLLVKPLPPLSLHHHICEPPSLPTISSVEERLTRKFYELELLVRIRAGEYLFAFSIKSLLSRPNMEKFE